MNSAPHAVSTRQVGGKRAALAAFGVKPSSSLPAYAGEKFARDSAKQTKQVRRAA